MAKACGSKKKMPPKGKMPMQAPKAGPPMPMAPPFGGKPGAKPFGKPAKKAGRFGKK